MPPPPLIVDARGLRCPLPVLRLARALRMHPETTQFKLLSDDRATPSELVAWCAATGHTLADDLQIIRNKFANATGSH